MLEMLVNPKKAERRPWEMFFIGLLYASLSFLIVNWVFVGQDVVLSKRAGVLVVLFTVLFSLPFVYYLFKFEEARVIEESKRGWIRLLKDHRRAIYALMFMFLGFTLAFSFWYSLASETTSFRAQIETYCAVNRPSNFDQCVVQYGVKEQATVPFLTNKERLFLIFTNNMYVLIFTLITSLLVGAGAIFILAWNASVIGAAIGIFTDYKLAQLPLGLTRFFIHGIPEIASYFIVALAGGMVSMAIVNKETNNEKFWSILQDSLNLIIVAVVILFIAAVIEVFVTPLFF